MGYFPLAGLVLGLILAGWDGVLRALLPPPAAAALLLVSWVWLTGAVHLDGFMDTCDGILGHRAPEARLRIMRESTLGSFGALGGFGLLLVKYGCLVSLPGPLGAPTLVLMVVLARWAMVYAVVAFPYARPGPGIGRLFKEQSGPSTLACATAVAAALAFLVGRWGGLGMLLAVALSTWLAARYIMARIPGLTGDNYGAVAELAEVWVLVLAVAAGWGGR